MVDQANTVVRIEIVEGSPTSTATAFVADAKVAWATEVRPERAVRECMRQARLAVPGAVQFVLPYCGKKFHVPWWEEREPVPLKEQARLRSRGRAPQC